MQRNYELSNGNVFIIDKLLKYMKWNNALNIEIEFLFKLLIIFIFGYSYKKYFKDIFAKGLDAILNYFLFLFNN